MEPNSSYAYIDKSNVLHIVDDKNDSARNTAGKVVETDISHMDGYPVIDGKQVVYYSDSEKAYLDGNKDNGKSIPVPASIQTLVEQMK